MEPTVAVSHQAARAAGQVNNATARLGPEVLPAQEVPRAKVAPSARSVDKAALLARVDGPVALGGNSRAAAEPWGLGGLPEREVRPGTVAP